MLEKYGMFKDDEGNLKAIYKDEKGYIDVDFRESNTTDTILVSSTYDMVGKEQVSVSDVYYVINKCFGYLSDGNIDRQKNSKKLEVYVRNTGSIQEEWFNLFRSRSSYFKNHGYSQIWVLPGLSNVLGTELDNDFIYKMLHTTDYNKGNELNFFKWVKKYMIVEKQREDYISWDEYFMAISKLSAMRSKDPNTQVGACIVSEDNRLLSIGYNGAPNGYKDYKFPWDREGENLKTKYPFVVHAERNAILNYRGSRQDFIGARIYVDLFPCNECAKEIIQAGISEVIYLSDKYADTESTIASKMLLDECGVKYRQLGEEYRKVLTIDLRK